MQEGKVYKLVRYLVGSQNGKSSLSHTWAQHFLETNLGEEEQLGYWKIRGKQQLVRFYLHDESEGDLEKCEDNARRKLLMFKPWRDPEELRDLFPTYLEAWQHFIENSSANCRHAIEELLCV